MIFTLQRRYYQKVLAIFAIVLFTGLYAKAQNSSQYGFAQTTGTYTAITGTTSSATGDDGFEDNLPIGFSFVFAGTTYTTFSVTTNGMIRLGNPINTASSYEYNNANFGNFTTTNTNVPMIAGFWDDNGISAGAGGNIQYLTQGTTGNQTLTVQFTNCAFSTGGTGSSITFQIVLHEVDGQIDIIYGGVSGTSSESGTIGISSGLTDYLSVTPGAPATASSTTANNSINPNAATIALLTSGTTYSFIAPVACAGQPVVGQTTASVANACVNNSFTLGVSGLPVSSGFTYEFQSSPAGAGTYTSLAPAQTASTYTVTSQTAATDYQVIVTCTNSGLSTTATFVNVGQNLFYNCYCAPASTCTNEGIENVTFGTLNNSSTFCASTSGYSDYKSLGSLNTVTQAQQVPISVGAHVNDINNYAGAWIDYNHNSIFEASEFTNLGSFTQNPVPSGGASHTFTANINIPGGALTGVTGMRVRQANGSGVASGSACPTSTVYGEYEDYLITINAGTACAGAPNAGTVAASVANVACGTLPFTLSSTGYTTGVTGLTFQWQESNDGINFIDIGPIDTVNYTDYTIAGISQTMYYRLEVTCTNGTPTVALSNVDTVYFAPFAAPYTYDVQTQNINSNSVMVDCWSSVPTNTTSAYAWHVTTLGTQNSSNTGPFISGSTNRVFYTEASSGSTSNVAELITPPIDLTALTSPLLEFYYHMYGVNMGSLSVEIDNGGGWTPIGTTITGQQQTSQGAAFIKNSIPLTGYTGVVQIKFIGTRGAGFESDITIDDIAVIETPSCLAPSMPIATAQTTTTADLTWNENGTAFQWQIEYGVGNFTQGTGTLVTANTNMAFPLTGLTAATSYTYFVRSICNAVNPGGDTSVWSGRSAQFMTPCNAITTFPFVETFEPASTSLACWSSIDGNNDGDKWQTYTGYSFNGTSSIGLYTDFNAGNNSDWYVSPPFTLTGNQRLVYWYRARSTTEPNDYTVKLSTTTNDTSAFTTVLKPLTSISNTTYQSETIDLSAYTGTVYLAFHVPPGGLDGYYIYFDDVTVEDIPSCPAPTSLSVGNRTNNSFDITWTSTSSTVILEYGPIGYTPGTGATAGVGGTLVASPATPQTISGLTANTGYAVYVREDCTGVGNGYSTNATITTGTTPLNDDCAGATVLTLNAAPITDSNRWASNDVLPTTTCGTSSGTGDHKGLWYSFTAPYTGSFTLSTCDATVDIYGRIYEGSCGSFTACAGSDDDDCPLSASPLETFPGVANTTYYILIGNYSSGTSPGTFPISISTPLSIKLDNIKATNQGDVNRVEWNTLSEERSDRFELERSTDGREFVKIHEQNANGVSSKYSYIDNSPVKGINHYRLKMLTATGEVEYSKVVTAVVNGKDAFVVRAYPNPITDNKLTVEVTGTMNNNPTILVTDITGKVVKSVNVVNSKTDVDMTGLSSGVYFVKYMDAVQSHTIKVTK